MKQHQQIIVAMTGASGAAYGLRLMQRLGDAGVRQHVLLSEAARIVIRQEQSLTVPEDAKQATSMLTAHLRIPESLLSCYALTDWYAPAASGSAGIRQMVVIPCSMGTLARIATGVSGNLIERAADVMLKESGRLIVMPRETPLSSIHLEHMLKLSNMGVHILPAMPGFYQRPTSIETLIDFMVDRVLDHLDIHQAGQIRWGD